MKSVMAHSFAQVPRANIPRSSFNRSHGLKTTFDADYLIPILVDDIIPGDTFNVNVTHFARLATPTFPIMDNMYLETFFFFVPYRLVWDNWEKFCGAQLKPADSIDYTIPVVNGSAATTGEGSMWDYFGLPLDDGTGAAHVTPNNVTISALPFRAYDLIYREWFRDQNLQDSPPCPTDDGPDTLNDYASTIAAADGVNYVFRDPVKRGKRHDYFTSCLPWPQKGTAASFPLSGTANVHGDATGLGIAYAIDNDRTSSWTQLGTSGATLVDTATAGLETNALFVDLSEAASSITINDVRLAFQTQRLLERDARSGTRYVETILAHYGVTVPDFRVQRPEFLGGGSSVVNITPVQNNSGSSG